MEKGTQEVLYSKAKESRGENELCAYCIKGFISGLVLYNSKKLCLSKVSSLVFKMLDTPTKSIASNLFYVMTCGYMSSVIFI